MDKYPDKTKSDYAHSATKAGLSCIPVIGGAVSTLFETVLSSPIDKRKEQWLLKLAGVIEQLSDTVEGLKPENLADNEEFVSICIQASNIALRTHQNDKIERLLNAVRNTIAKPQIDESKRMIFIRIIDEMTELHFKVFVFLAEIEVFIQKLNSRNTQCLSTHWGDARNVWKETYPEINPNDHMLDVIIGDLNRYGLVSINKFYEARLSPVTTSFGKEFHDYTKSGL